MTQAQGSVAVRSGWIDTHHHIYPPRFIAEEYDRIVGVAPGWPAELTVEWNASKSIEDMDRNGVAAAVVSIAAPGVWSGNTGKAKALARDCNEFGAKLITDYPQRFGMFAALPLPDVDASLREIEYALDGLNLDGFGILTSYGDKWPGDSAFSPVFDELNRRSAIVYFHPKSPDAFQHVLPDVPDPILEFVFDTTRAIASLLYSGTLSRCPNIRYVFSHAGGTAPYLLGRIASLGRRASAVALAARIPNGAEYELSRFYYDMAASATPQVMASMRTFIPQTNILFGSDFPYRSAKYIIDALQQLNLSEQERRLINNENARQLFPRLSQKAKAEARRQIV
jgi:predicted TIM-barrel fold metal-dependent hydrolase